MIEYRATCGSCGWVSLTYEQQDEAEAARLRHETTHEGHDTWMHALPVGGRSLPGRSVGDKRRSRRAPPDAGPCSIRTQEYGMELGYHTDGKETEAICSRTTEGSREQRGHG